MVNFSKFSIKKMLRDIAYKGILVVVEGRKDRIALESFAIKNVRTLTKPLYLEVDVQKFKMVKRSSLSSIPYTSHQLFS